MPQLNLKSRSGRDYEIDVPEGTTLTPELESFFKDKLDQFENPHEQGGFGAFGSGLAQGATSAFSQPIRGAGALSHAEPVLNFGTEMQDAANNQFPIAEANERGRPAQWGQAIGQGLAQLLTTLGTAYISRSPQATIAVPRVMAGLSGAASGYDEAKRLGIDPYSPEGYAMMTGYGGAEVLSESLFGIGSSKFSKGLVSDIPNILRRGSPSTWFKRGGKAVLQEGIEEPIAGVLQSGVSRGVANAAGIVDDTGEHSTVTGAELPDPFNWEDRLHEFELGMVGAAGFGVHSALDTDADKNDVRAYRQRVDEARRAGTIKPDHEKEVNYYDKQAAEFLEPHGVEDMRDLLNTNLNGTSQGVVELRHIINDPAAAPATKAAAAAKLDDILKKSQVARDAADRFLKGEITLAELRNSFPEYENLNPYSQTNQQRQLDEAAKAKAQTPVAVAADRKSTRLNSSHIPLSRMPSSA